MTTNFEVCCVLECFLEILGSIPIDIEIEENIQR